MVIGGGHALTAEENKTSHRFVSSSDSENGIGQDTYVRLYITVSFLNRMIKRPIIVVARLFCFAQ